MASLTTDCWVRALPQRIQTGANKKPSARAGLLTQQLKQSADLNGTTQDLTPPTQKSRQ